MHFLRRWDICWKGSWNSFSVNSRNFFCFGNIQKPQGTMISKVCVMYFLFMNSRISNLTFAGNLSHSHINCCIFSLIIFRSILSHTLHLWSSHALFISSGIASLYTFLIGTASATQNNRFLHSISTISVFNRANTPLVFLQIWPQSVILILRHIYFTRFLKSYNMSTYNLLYCSSTKYKYFHGSFPERRTAVISKIIPFRFNRLLIALKTTDVLYTLYDSLGYLISKGGSETWM